MKSPFKIGDTVKVIKVHQLEYLQDWVNKENLKKLGKIGKIKQGWRVSEKEFRYSIEGVGFNISSNDLKLVEEEIKNQKPKFKVGDYVVYESRNMIRYIKIIEIRKKGNNFLYNQTGGGYYFGEEYLRLPIQEELEKYFR